MNNSTCKVLSVSEVKTEKRTKDKKANRQFFTVKYSPENILLDVVATRNVWQKHNSDGTSAAWGAATHSEVSKLVGKNVPAEIKSVEVQPYEIKGNDGVLRTVNTTTLIQFKGESLATAVRAVGRKLPVVAPELMLANAGVEEDAEAIN